ncbi:MAG: hypothetical protein EP146_15250 [Oscillibacter sp.]|uniref:hypothetical protein n=1 Tax=Oscillibacter sp. TaxID=1945593 RepID=UPI00132B9113|nr:hypothetical protein [Oscillibacter sp.]MUU12685.1 hypothetical protein [Oscillibacter sp.]
MWAASSPSEHNTLSYSDSGGYAVSMDSFSDLFGHDGLVIRYSGELDEHTGATFHDYYYFDTEEIPSSWPGYGTESAVLDLDGDGANELLSDGGQLVFQRDGQLYEEAGGPAGRNWPEMDFWDYSTIDVSRRCLTVRGTVRNER